MNQPDADPPNQQNQCASCKWAMEIPERYDQVRCCCESSENAWGDVEAADCCEFFEIEIP
jgi:hypothetical protein